MSNILTFEWPPFA